MSAAERLDQTLLALADPARRRAIELLRESPRRAGELASALHLVPPAMSRHLRVLRTSGLVEEESLPEDARVRVYRLRAEPFTQLRGWLEQVEAFWTDQLQAFKEHAERKLPRAASGRAAQRVGKRSVRAPGRRKGGPR